jgi:hypothetical protein
LIRTFTIVLVLGLSACERPPESYPPPEQRHPVEGSNPSVDDMMVDMADLGADEHIVKDMLPGGDSGWRWTGSEPTFRVLVHQAEGVKLSADFMLWDEAFRQTGPLELAFLVNGRQLATVRYDSPGQKHFEKPVPRGWVEAGTQATIAMRVGKLYVAPEDGAKFGVILSRIGLVQ